MIEKYFPTWCCQVHWNNFVDKAALGFCLQKHGHIFSSSLPLSAHDQQREEGDILQMLVRKTRRWWNELRKGHKSSKQRGIKRTVKKTPLIQQSDRIYGLFYFCKLFKSILSRLLTKWYGFFPLQCAAASILLCLYISVTAGIFFLFCKRSSRKRSSPRIRKRRANEKSDTLENELSGRVCSVFQWKKSS